MNITLRLLSQSDLDNLLLIENDKRYWHLSGTTEPFIKEELSDYISNSNIPIEEIGQIRFVIDTGNKFAGLIDLYDYEKGKSAGVGIILFDEFHKKGIAQKALALLKSYCKEKLNINSLFARIEDDNTSSIKLFEKAEFVLQEKLPQYILRNNAKINCGEYWLNI